MHGLRFAKTHFGFGGVHVHIHRTRIEREFEHKTRRRAAVHLVAQRVANSVQHHFVAHPTAIDEQVLRVAIGHRAIRPQHKTFYRQQPRIRADRGGRV